MLTFVQHYSYCLPVLIFVFCTMRLVITVQRACYFSPQAICSLIPPSFPSCCDKKLCTLCTIIGVSCVLGARLLLLLVIQLQLLGLVGLGVEHLSCCVLCRGISGSLRGLILHTSITRNWSLTKSTQSVYTT